MTTPISSLKKTKRSPLPSPSHPTADPSVPFRHPDFSDDQIQHLTENVPAFRLIRTMRPFRQSECGLSLLETINTSPRGVDDSATLQDEDSSSTLSSNDHELISLLMSRLVQLENRLADAQKQLIDKEKKIYKLEDNLRSLEKVGLNAASNSELDLRYKKLQQQVSEMEKFLNDYGMIWIGSTRSSSFSNSDSSKDERMKSDPLWKTDSSVQSLSNKDFHVDYDLVVGNIKELNILAGDGKSQVDVSEGSARLKTIEPIPLTLYANGILMFSGPFRPFTDARTRDCIQDFMDGFYPSELQPVYPDGVPFKVTDKRHVVYRGDKIPFTGIGMNLSGCDSYHPEADDSEMKESLFVTPDVTDKPSSTRRFLEKLPKVVINSGKLFNIRDSIAQNLQDSHKINNKIVNIPTLASKRNGEQKAKRKMVSIRLKSENGTEVYLLKLYVDETVADLCKYLDSFRADCCEYEIISLCPFKVFNNKNATLREYGLLQNVALYLRKNSTIINQPQ